MRLIFLVTALAVLNIAWAKNSTAKTKPKRQLDNIRTPQNLQYSLVLPHSRVQHFRSLGNSNSNRRISHATVRGGKLPPYAVQMEPVVQYSQKDPLYDPSLDNLEDSVVNKNEIYAQSKILNTHDFEENYGPPYGSLPTAPLYSQEPHPQYYEAPEPIIEIIIKESNESIPAPPPLPIQKKKKEPVHVFYVKYSKDPHSKDKVIYEKPIPAITPPTNEEEEEEHHEEYITVTPEPYIPLKTTTLRAIIKPESEVYHSDSSVRVTFGNEDHHHYSDRREGSSNTEEREETAPRPAIAFPNPQQNHPSQERSVSSQLKFSHEPETKSTIYHSNGPAYRSSPQHAQSRIQFQPQSFPTEQLLPRQNPTTIPFRTQSHANRHPFASPSSLIPNPAFANAPPPIITHFGGPTVPTPLGPVFPTNFPRINSGPTFNPRPNNPPQFISRPLNSPSRNNFHSGPQRPFHQQPQQKPYFDEAKYLQENYHTITTEQVDPPKDQLLPSRQTPTFSRLPKPGPSPTPSQFQEHSFNRPQIIPHSQQLPQQRPPQHFVETKPSLSVSPSGSPFYNLKPSPPHIENNRPSFNQPPQQFSFHQGPSTIPQHSFSGPVTASPSPISHHQFLPQPSSPSIYNFQPQVPSQDQIHFNRQNSPSEISQYQSSHRSTEQPQFQRPHSSSERPQFLSPQSPSESSQFHQLLGSSERPSFHQNHRPSERPVFNEQSNYQDHHLQHVNQFVPNGGELIAAIPKYEQHITINGPTIQPSYSGLIESSQLSPAHSYSEQQYHNYQQQLQQQQNQNEQQRHREQQQRDQQQQQDQQQQRNQQHQREEQQQREQQREKQQQREQHREQQYHREQQQQQQQQQHREQKQRDEQKLNEQHHQQQQYEAEQEQVRQQLAHNVRKQQEEIQRLQAQLLHTQQQQQTVQQYNQQFESSTPRSQYIQERSRPQPSTPTPDYYQSSSRTVEIRPTTQKYVSSTANSISSTPESKKEEKKKKPTFELPDEVPDDLRQHLLSSGILDNADISVLDYDKVGETPLESLPPDQLANFFSAGGGQQIASSENRPVYIKPNGDQVESRIVDDLEDDQDTAASENVPTYVSAPQQKQAVEMKVVHFDPNTDEGQKIANEYVNENATRLDPVALNDKKYNRYLPLKVSGNQFPLPDILKGRKVTSVVVLAPVETEALNFQHARKKRATSNNLKGIKFVAGDSLQDLLRKPNKANFKKWLEVEKKTASDLQSIILLVTGTESGPEEEKEIYMYDIASGNVSKLSGELSNAFVEAAENNSLSKDIEKLAIEGEGTPENFQKEANDDVVAESSDNVPLFVDLSGVSLDAEHSNHVSITSGYSKTKLGRSLKRQ